MAVGQVSFRHHCHLHILLPPPPHPLPSSIICNIQNTSLRTILAAKSKETSEFSKWIWKSFYSQSHFRLSLSIHHTSVAALGPDCPALPELPAVRSGQEWRTPGGGIHGALERGVGRAFSPRPRQNGWNQFLLRFSWSWDSTVRVKSAIMWHAFLKITTRHRIHNKTTGLMGKMGDWRAILRNFNNT